MQNVCINLLVCLVPTHAARHSCHIDLGAIVQYWHVTPLKWEPFVQECKILKCAESLDNHRDAWKVNKPGKILKILKHFPKYLKNNACYQNVTYGNRTQILSAF